MLFLHENQDANCELNYFVQEKKAFPVYGNDTRPWRYSVNLNTRSTENDIVFTEQQYRGVREIIEYYTWETVRRRYKRSSSYEDWIYSDCWMTLSRMRDHMNRLAKLREQRFREEFRREEEDLLPEFVDTEEWSNEEWTPVLVEKISERRRKLMQHVDDLDDMIRYLRFARKCKVEMWRMEKEIKMQQEKNLMEKIYEWCSLTLPELSVHDFDEYDSREDWEAYASESSEEPEDLDLTQFEFEDDFEEEEPHHECNYSCEACWWPTCSECSSEISEVSSVSSYSIDGDRPDTPSLSEISDLETQGDDAGLPNDFDVRIESESEEEMEIEQERSVAEVDGNIVSLITDLDFRIPISENWRVYISALYKSFIFNSSYEPVEFSWLRNDLKLPNVLKQAKQCLSGRKSSKFVKAALIILRHFHQTDKLHFPYQYVVNTLSYEQLCEMFETFLEGNAIAHKVGINGKFFQQFMLYSLAFEIAKFPEEFKIDNEPETQGDNTGEVLEKIENVEKTHNVTLVHERPVNVVTAHHTDGASTRDQHHDTAESPYSMGQMLSRNIQMAKVEWSTADKVGRKLTAMLPYEYMSHLSIPYNLMRTLAFARFDMHLTVMFNGNKYMQGAMAAGIGPPRTVSDNTLSSVDQDYNLPFGILQAPVSNVLEFKVPFNNIYTFLSQQNNTMRDEAGWNSIGFFWLNVLVPLTVPTGCATSVDIEVYARLENMEFHQTVVPFTNFSFSEKFINVMAHGAPTDMETQGNEDTVINKSSEPLMNSTHVSKLDTGASSIRSDPQTYVKDELSFEYLFKIPSLLDKFQWKQTQVPGTKLWTWIVSPTFVPSFRTEDAKEGGTLIYPTMLGYIARSFLYYDGDFILKFVEIANDYYSGRIKVWQDTHWTSNRSHEYSLESMSNINSIVVDLQQQNEFEMRVPFTSIKPLLRCDKFRSLNSPTGYLGEWHQGVIGVSVLNRLVGSPNCPGTVDFAVFIYAADNFRVAVPVPKWNLHIYRGKGGKSNMLYPVSLQASDQFQFHWKHYIFELYHRGGNLWRYGLIVPDEKYWFKATTMSDLANEDAYKWVFECSRLVDIVADKGTAQAKMILSLRNYGGGTGKGILDTAKEILETVKKLPKNAMLETQGLERYVTTGDEHPAQFLLTKDRRSHNSKVMDAAYVPLRRLMERFWPLAVVRPIIALAGYVEITVPVHPTLDFDEQVDSINASGLESPGLSQVAWICNLGTYWEGALKYKIVTSRTDTEIIAVHAPNIPQKHGVRLAVDEMTVQQFLSYGSDIEVTHLAGGMEVVVPYRSSFNQLLIPKTKITPDLRYNNGVLKFFLRTKNCQDCSTISANIFIAIGDDFKLNWTVGPPTILEPEAKIKMGNVDYTKNKREFVCPYTNDYAAYVGPTTLDFGVSSTHTIVTQLNYNPTPEQKVVEQADDFETQGMGDFVEAISRPNRVMRKVEEAATSVPVSLEKIANTVEQTSQEFTRMSSEFTRQSQSVVEDVSSVRNNINCKLNSLTGDIHSFVDRAGDAVDSAAYYVNMTATTVLSGNVIRSFIKAVQQPCNAGSWIDLGISFAALLGFSVKHIIVKCVNSVLDWFHGNEQPRAQALSGASLNEIEENEDTIIKSVAVLGTILYAYIFECIPDFTNLKKMIKNMLNRDPETQGLNLRGAHFAYMGLSALSKVFDNIIFYTKKFLDWLLERDSPEALCARRAAHIQERVLQCIKDIDFYDNEYEILKALVDPDAHNKIYKIVDETNELTDIFIRDKLDSRIGQILTECRTRAKALVKKLESEAPSHGWRFDPYIIVIHGQSGTGKSHIMHDLMNLVAEEWKLPKYNRIYSKTVKDDFWSGYTGQPIIQWDEFGQNPENDKQAVELIELRSNLPKRLNMAALHEKGRYFNSKAMFITTNVPYIRYDANIRDDVAFKRRRHFMLEMQHRPGFDANTVQNLPRFDATYSHCRFRRTDNMRPTTLPEVGWVPLQQIKDTIRAEVRAWYAKQMDMYEDYMQTHGLGVMPRGVVHVSAPVEVQPNMSVDEVDNAIRNATANLSADEEIVADLPRVTRYEERDGETIRVTTPTGSTRPVHLEAEGRDYNVTASAFGPKQHEGWGCTIQGNDEPIVLPGATPFMSTESFQNRMIENDEFLQSENSSVATMTSSSAASTVPSLISASTASLESDRTGEALMSNWDLFNIVVNHNRKPYDSVPVTAKEFLYVSGAVKSPEFERLSEEEKFAAEDYLQRQATTIATSKTPPEKIKKAWYKRVWEKISTYFIRAKEVFKSIASKVVDFFKTHPKISIGFAILAALGAVAGTMWLIQQEVEPQYEEATSKWNVLSEESDDDMLITAEDDVGGEPVQRVLKVHRVVESGKHYELNQNRKGYRKVVAQGCEDPNAMNIRAKVHQNLLIIGWPEGASKKCTMRCLHLRGRLILVPFHFFANAREGESFVLCHRSVPLTVEYNEARMHRIDNKDFVVYDCGAKLEPRRDIVKYFISEKDLGKVPKCNVVLCNIECDGTLLMMSGAARATKEYSYKDNTSGDVYVQDGWEVNMSTSSGDCGSFLLGLCKQISGAGKILGIHTAGSKSRSVGFSVLITSEMLEKACETFKGIVQGLPIPPEMDNSEGILFKIIPKGDYSVYGVMPNHLSPAQPHKTSLRKTPFLDEDLVGIANLRKPAHLKPFVNINGDRISPLRIALEKYGGVTISFPHKDVLAAKAHLLDIFKNTLESPGLGVLTVEQAVLGIPGNEFARPLNLKSAAGWPYQVLEKETAGKYYLFNDDGKIVNKELQKRYDERLKAAKQLERVPSVWRDCLKDELRPVEKVEAGKSRLFTIAPVDYNILVRQYFMDFNVAFYAANCKFFSAVGIDPESTDWTRMYKYLAECGTKTIAGDYSSFDGTLMPDLMDTVCDVVNEWYNDGPINANVRKTLVNEMIHTMQLVENTVYASHQGNPSGNPETAILNTAVGFLYLMLAFKRIYPDRSLADFRKYCRAIIYGDDLVVTVREELEEFNQENLTKVFAERGIKFTNEAKDGRDVGKFRELKDVTFLKRSFRKDPEFGTQFWLAAISEETLTSYFHWVRETPDLEEQLQENMTACLRFAAFHGREKYNWYLEKWQTCMKNIGYKSITTTFEEQVDNFHYNAGMMCRDPKFHTMLKDLTTEGDASQTIMATIEEKKEQPSRVRLFMETAWEVTKFAAGYYFTWKALEWLTYAAKECDERNQNAAWSRTDTRCAVCIPSGEGKTTLANKHPTLFIDHDEYLLQKDEYKLRASCAEYIRETVEEEFGKPVEKLNLFERAKLNQAFGRMYETWVRKHDAPENDRRILLTHHPRNTKRQIVGVFLLPKPTGVRQNIAGRKALEQLNPTYLDYDDRERELIQIAFEKEGLKEQA